VNADGAASATVIAVLQWALRVGAEEVGLYLVVDGSRVVVPLSLTADEPPGPEPALPASPAGPRPG